MIVSPRVLLRGCADSRLQAEVLAWLNDQPRDRWHTLAAPGGTYTTREEAAEILAKIGYSAPAKPRVDPKAWAHRVLARAAAGDESLALESIRMAERALKATDEA